MGRDRTTRWLDEVILPQASALARLSFVACVPYPLIPGTVQHLTDSGVSTGAQNCWHGDGDGTGEVSAGLLAELDCGHVMLGHAERRRLFHEDDTLVARKAAAVAGAGMTPLVCVGEERHVPTEAAASRVARQAQSALGRIDPDRPALVLYEPAWAIGNDHGAEPGHAAAVLRALHAVLSRQATRFLYGGAVTPGTYTALRAAAAWDGVAVGRAAQDPHMLHEVTAELLAGAPGREAGEPAPR
ncbi:triose-phosphate isomerase family protein [Streptomyces cyaneofuscatus]|uniref:triose-phosphate isomerase n=1 Tax=Streptomyces cyaneofuscatus TaxID=66883 RepID=UPI0029539BE4|nr:triose-phosphate isomerase family protein [Streptomyces cyaneofuscatus]WOP13762.1 triose-phosphate isomerase family protein [Streptomyces cyaneofuscatus]